MKHTYSDLKQKQSLPLEAKIKMSKDRIRAWLEYWDYDCYVSFSGGKDSTVLLDLCRQVDPNIKAIFVDTGLEFPEIKKFVRSFDNIEILRPKMPFREVINKYGYPVISKQVSMGLDRYRNTKSDEQKQLRLFGGVNPTSGKKQNRTIPLKYHYLKDAPFKISERCCDVMKKSPIKSFERKTGLKPIIGTMAVDSDNRKLAWLKTGCNSFNSGSEKSTPLSFWLEQDIWEYIKKFNIEYSPIYNQGYDRTGCVFCMFGIMQEKEDRFERLNQTHPKLYNFCMNKLGMKEVLKFIKG